MTYKPQSFGRISTPNRSLVALGAGATFTGAGELTDFPDIMLSVNVDQPGTLFVDFSNDGTNWGTFPVVGFAVAAGIHEFHTAVKGPRWFRTRYVNGATAQGSMGLYAYAGVFSKAANAPLNQSISGDSDSSLVRAVLTGQNLTNANDFPNVRTTPAGAIMVGDFLTEVALGRVPGYMMGTKFGRNSDVDPGTPEDIFNGGGNYAGQPTSNLSQTVHVFSSSVNDTAVGTGARTVEIRGLKTSASTVYETETVTLMGTVSVTSASAWYRVNRVRVLTAGTGGGNAGTITVRHSGTAANVFAVVGAGWNQTLVAAYTVPAATSMLLKRLRVAIVRANGSAGSATITLRVRPPGGVYNAVRVFECQTGAPVEFVAEGGEVFAPGSDIKFRVESVSDTNTVAEAAIEFVLIAA